MVEIRDHNSFKAWLNGRVDEEVIAIAARAALRALPISSRIFESSAKNPRSGFVIAVFRASANARTAAVGHAHKFDFSAAAFATKTAATVAIDAAKDTNGPFGSAFAAGRASIAIDAAIGATNNGLGRDGATSAAVWNAGVTLDHGLWTAATADATALEDGTPAATLAAAPLWPDEPPEWVEEHWAKLTAELRKAPDEDWGVWIDWYDARLRGDPPNEALERARVLEISEEMWEAGPKVVNAEIRRLIEKHTKPPKTPPQELAPVMAEIRDGEISRRNPDAPAHEADMATIHGLLLTEAQWLSTNLSNQHGPICDMVGNAVTALGDSLAETDALTLGFHSKPIASRAKTANEDLLEDQAAKLQGFSANLDLFVMRLEDWRKHIAAAAENAVTPEEIEVTEEETKSLLDGIWEWSKDLYDERIPALLDELYLSLSESSVYGVETPYGFYLSLRNVLTITMQAAINAIPTDLIREESDEVIKSLRKKARKFVHEYARELTIVTGLGLFEGLKAALRFILGG